MTDRHQPGASAPSKTTLHIDAMDCPNEERLIRSRLRGVGGVERLDFDLVRRQLTVTHRLDDAAPVLAALASVGMNAEPAGPETDAEGDAAPRKAWARRPVVSRAEWVQLGVAGVLALAAEVVALATADEGSAVVAGLALAAIALGGREMLLKGWRAVRAFSLGINFLMTVAVAGAVLIGEWPEAAMVAVLFAIAEKVEAYALDRSRGAIRSLMELAPDTALVWTESPAGCCSSDSPVIGGNGSDGDGGGDRAGGRWEEVRASAVRVGQRFRVRPGERVPLDGTVVAGGSSVNQAPITGESMPVAKGPGDEVFAGTVNERGALEVEATHRTRDTALARIVRAVQQAQAERGQTQRFVDRFAEVYTPLVVVAAVLVAIGPPLLVGAPFLDWLYRALVLLVIACPCALVISTPVTVVSGLAAAARRGMLVKGGAFLESGHLLRVVALDKTGTVTEGRPRVTDIVPLASHLTEADALRLAARLDAPSEHPVAAALAEAYREQAPDGALGPVDDFEAVTGRGVRGRIGGAQYRLGNGRYARESGVSTPALEARLEALEREGKTAIVLFTQDGSAQDGGPGEALAAFGVADTVRPTSVEALRDLHALGVRTVMLSGDNQTTAEAIAREVGIDDARGGLLPEDKLAAVDEIRARYGPVGMVGDGINDAPALAKADIGFAMGAAGTDTALETADVALMEDDLRRLPDFLRLSRQTARVLRQNIALALGIKAVFFGLAVFGIATLWMAVVADMGASLLVTFNGLRLLRT